MYYGEKFNSITHLVGAVLAVMGFGALLTVSIQHRDPWMIISFTVFGMALVLLYTLSTLYHSVSSPRIKRVLQKLDHCAIYLLIAGTYTPYMLVSLRPGNGLQMLAFIWGLGFVGLLVDLLIPRRIELLQVILYLSMGWACVLEYEQLKAQIATPGFIWLNIGGLSYTVGILFYVLDHQAKLRYAHGIWHLFVMLGSISHFISVIGYVH
ncbi:PAQR family membrane homeostasis protein TrhA [Motiliproteus sediminis]|uniref:PAQR family membrane homeostasis protein TrhA n=1 Tax=Motiliproteus sediminis TaxID=1468178 RepID=UPI001AEFEAC6|nr:hemolysin III family protein [Motiliproteus sediminis]